MLYIHVFTMVLPIDCNDKFGDRIIFVIYNTDIYLFYCLFTFLLNTGKQTGVMVCLYRCRSCVFVLGASQS